MVEDEPEPEKKKVSKLTSKKGMTLGSKKQKQLEKEQAKEKEIAEQKTKDTKPATKKAPKDDEDDELTFNPLDSAVEFLHEESVSCDIDKDSKLVNFSVKGSLTFVIKDPKRKRLAVKVDKTAVKEKVKMIVPASFNKEV